MRRRQFITLVGGAAAWPLALRAQQSALPTVGFLRSSTLADVQHWVAAFRRALKEAGFVEGQNVAIEYRFADNQPDRLPVLLMDLICHPVAVIVGNLDSALAAKAATTTVPIVFATGSDPVRDGLVASLNRPGGNEQIEGLTVIEDGLLLANRKRIAELAIKSRLPSVGFREYCAAGGLAAYGVDFPYIWRRGGVFVDKILKGAKPADLPIEQASKFEFIINLRTAKSLGLSVPPTLLARADEVIE